MLQCLFNAHLVHVLYPQVCAVEMYVCYLLMFLRFFVFCKTTNSLSGLRVLMP